MEADVEKESDEPFLKIGMIWSEAEENIEKVAIKEEVVSDSENKPKSPIVEEDTSDQEQENSNCKMANRDKSSGSNFAKSYALLWPSKKKYKNLKPIDDPDLGNSSKSWCSHNVKNFKLVKKRLRCSECRSLVCPECCKVTFSTLQNHLSGSDPYSFGFYCCKSCPLAFHSLCALQAHVRIHSLESPHVCPDCGLIYNNIYFLILHLINKCYHVYKIIRYKCKNCQDAYFSPTAFVEHLKEVHMSTMLKCSYCSLLFDSNEEFDNHMDVLHHKQKIQRLKYYSCLLCSNMLIPDFMYQKHVEQHCDNPDSYEIDYQCCCGEISRMVSPFRAHILYCAKKGILPSYWGFLQKNLKPQGVASLDNVLDEQDPLAQNDIDNSNLSPDSKTQKFNLSRGNSISEGAQDENMDTDDVEEGNSLLSTQAKNNLNDLNEEKNDKSSKETNKSTISVKLLLDSSLSKDSDPPKTTTQSKSNEVEEVELLSSDSNASENRRSVEEVDKDVDEKNSGAENEKIIENCEKNHPKEKDGVHGDSETSKTVYDHIPCDHLGYLRIQCSDLNKKESVVGEIKFGEEMMIPTSPKEFQIITELDEKTGVMLTRKVAVDRLNDDDTDCKDDNSEASCCSNNTSREMFNGDRVKIKLGSSAYFMCPFCVVLFPKGISAFQQFRLHIECYHSDSALNIAVHVSENEKTENNQETTTKEAGKCEPEKSDASNKLNDSGELSVNKEQQSSSRPGSFKVKTYLRKPPEGGKKPEENSDNSNRENRLDKNTEDSANQNEAVQEGINDSNANKDSQLSNEEGKDNTTEESDKSLKKPNETNDKDMYWSVQLSVQSNGSTNHENKTTTLEDKSTTDDTAQKVLDKADDKEDGLEDNDSVAKKDKEKNSSCEPTKSEDEKDSKNDALAKEKALAISAQSRSCVVLLEKKDAENYTSTIINRERASADDQKDQKNLFRENSKTKKMNSSVEEVPSDYEEEYDNSKDSNWSAESSVEFVGESKNSDGLEGTSMRTRSAEKSKRESEVWSEFYESLKLAEKLKKSKKRKSSCHFENKKKCVVLPEYSAKRIVKKPKRYRQSSDSQDSVGEYEFSESENEGIFTDNLGSENYSQGQDEDEKGNVDGVIQKKQRLLNKIERIDPKVIDYLFELLKRKEKCYELFKKHSNLRASRYSQDLRSYRKKVLKGIKNRGRPYKVLRYQDMVKKKGLDDGVILEDEVGQSSRSKTPSPTDSKSSEKKRGRPRKMGKSGKLKERRRSDKEVDFIEKNFETEGGEGSLNKRKRKLSSKLQYYKKTHISEEKDEFSSGQVITNKSGDSSKKFTCAVCKDVFPDCKLFREHIVIHRMEEGTYQCMECGECFVVRPSLEKHLHAFHKIKNTDKYITENDCWNIRKDVADLDNEPLKENQCKVCKDQFDRAVDLTKHFRIHGMAFLKEFKKESKAK